MDNYIETIREDGTVEWVLDNIDEVLKAPEEGNEEITDISHPNVDIMQWESTQYQRDRANAYPTIQEQLDMQYWDSVNGTTVWKDTIEAIKAKYPKGDN